MIVNTKGVRFFRIPMKRGIIVDQPIADSHFGQPRKSLLIVANRSQASVRTVFNSLYREGVNNPALPTAQLMVRTTDVWFWIPMAWFK